MSGSATGPIPQEPVSVAAVLSLDLLRATGTTLAVAESLTGGLVLAALTDIPGASQSVRGGVVSYHADLKRGLLGVDADVIRLRGTVCREVAEQMAAGVAELCGADIGVATTGVAGPGPADGAEAGRFWVAGWAADTATAREYQVVGNRQEVRRAAVTAALGMVAAICRDRLRG